MGIHLDETTGDPKDPIGRLRGGAAALARCFWGRTPRVQEAVNGLAPIDREALSPRHFEQLGRVEAAQVMGITKGIGAKRCFRAPKRLKDVLATLPGGPKRLRPWP